MSEIAPKGKKIICAGCGDLIGVLGREMIFGVSRFSESTFQPDEGQVPWEEWDRFNCKKCDTPFDIYEDWFEEPDLTEIAALTRSKL